MLRTNFLLLSFIEKTYNENPKKGITLKDYPKGTFLCKQEEQPYKIAIIKNGFAKCFYSEENGKDFILEFLGKGEIVGEI